MSNQEGPNIIRSDIEIILPYLKNIGYNLIPEAGSYDKVAIRVTTHDAIRHLSFSIYHPKSYGLRARNIANKRAQQCNVTSKQLIYDLNGNVLLELMDSNDINPNTDESFDCYIDEGNSSSIFLDNGNVVLPAVNKGYHILYLITL